jgi:hypothetical protein
MNLLHHLELCLNFSTGVLLDAVVVELMEVLNIKERDMMEKHATIE